MIVIAPFMAFFMSLFTILRQFFRFSLSKIMVFFIRYLGRTPSRNSAIAQKISGPGMSKQFYMSINEEDVYVLTQA